MPVQIKFPNPEHASAEGFLATGGNLLPETLLTAYSQGIFPWYDRAGSSILWWSPDPRMVLFPKEFHLSRRLGRRIRQGMFQISENQAFKAVMQGCAEPRKEGAGTWIHQEMLDAYCRLHDLGYAHSVEVWENKSLVGGVYGLHLGQGWFAESMFSRCTDASKYALAFLAEKGKEHNWLFIDCQFHTDHLASLGAREIPRSEYLRMLKEAIRSLSDLG
ncbi:MAG: leucyl/phenylalanyl-tRNA--protein transferase [Mariprofundaceae bacterium]